jgi:hypothetical protein
MTPERQQPGFALLSLDDVARTLGVSKAWVRDHATRRSPRIPVVRLGGRTLCQPVDFPLSPGEKQIGPGIEMISTQLIEILQTSSSQNKEDKRLSTVPLPHDGVDLGPEAREECK